MCAWPAVCRRGESTGSSNPNVMFINFLSLCSFLCWAAEERKLVREAGKRQRRDPGWEGLNSYGGTGKEITVTKVQIWGRRENVDIQKGQKKGKEDKIASGCCAYEPYMLTPYTRFFDIYLYWYSNGNEEDENGSGRQLCVCRPC